MRVLIADDHPLFRGAMRRTVGAVFPDAALDEAASLQEATALMNAGGDPDLLLLDLAMPGMRGFSGLGYIRAQYPSLPVMVVSASDDPQVVRRCLDFGAAGFLSKTLDPAVMGEAMRQVLAGERWIPPGIDLSQPPEKEMADLVRRLSSLTPQQMRVLMMLSEGLLNKQIAYELGVSEATVKAHVSAILTKLGVESRTQAVIAAARIEVGQWQPGAA